MQSSKYTYSVVNYKVRNDLSGLRWIMADVHLEAFARRFQHILFIILHYYTYINFLWFFESGHLNIYTTCPVRSVTLYSIIDWARSFQQWVVCWIPQDPYGWRSKGYVNLLESTLKNYTPESKILHLTEEVKSENYKPKQECDEVKGWQCVPRKKPVIGQPDLIFDLPGYQNYMRKNNLLIHKY